MPPQEEPKKEEVQKVPEEPANDNSVGSMVEDIEMSAGCVADMQKTANPTAAQKELELNDVVNSAMVNRARELFDIKKITVKTKT